MCTNELSELIPMTLMKTMNNLYGILKRVMARFLSRLTMKNTGRCLFVDIVNGREVWLYVDMYGKEWMAQSKWEMRCAR